MYRKLIEATKFIEGSIHVKPKVAIVLGSGLGQYADRIKNAITIPFAKIPHFLPTSVEGHEGKLIIGTLAQPNQATTPAVPVAVLQGRLHFYEGHSMDQIVFPTRSLCMLGIDTIVMTNAAGGINPSFREADLILITDHINLMGDNPLRGPNLKELGPRFPDLTEAYSQGCLDAIRAAAARLGMSLREGVYAALSGPTYETPAEVRMLRALGADAVGMSTVPEVIAANHFGVRVTAVSCITNLAAGITSRKLSHSEIVQNAGRSASRLFTLLDEAIPDLVHTTAPENIATAKPSAPAAGATA
ncbi:MAG: purine-nucleoside phosphorylase [Deltaproteobacteria bacterium]|nr:purine-nucleoside phosphorylase [Deltaproteobacteria bacterium]